MLRGQRAGRRPTILSPAFAIHDVIWEERVELSEIAKEMEPAPIHAVGALTFEVQLKLRHQHGKKHYARLRMRNVQPHTLSSATGARSENASEMDRIGRRVRNQKSLRFKIRNAS